MILSKSNQIETEFINKYIVKLETYREDASSINDPSRNLNEFIEKIETILKLLSAKDKNKQKNGEFSLERKRESEDKNSGSDLKDSTLRNRESNKEHELGFTSDSLNISNLSFKDEKSLETENLMSIIKYLELENEALKETDITTYNKLIQKETEVTTVNQMLTHLYKEIDRLKIEIENNEKEIAEMQRKYKLEMDIIIADNEI